MDEPAILALVFGGLGYAARVTALSIVRELAPAAAPSATVIAIVGWSHRLGVEATTARLRPLLSRALAVSMLVLPIAIVVSGASSLLLLQLAGQSIPGSIRAASATISAGDLAAAFVIGSIHAVIAVGVAAVVVRPLACTSWNLPAKIVLVAVGLTIGKALAGIVSL